MPTLICRRCQRRVVWGLLSSQAWLEHRDGNGIRVHVCPGCAGEMDEDQRRTFTETGSLDGGAI